MPSKKQQYLRYSRLSSFGVVNSRKSDALLLEATRGRARWPQIIAPALEDVIIWDPRKGERVGKYGSSCQILIWLLSRLLTQNNARTMNVTILSLRQHNLITHICTQVAVLHGDKHEVSSLALSPDQATLAAGYEDGSVRLWSVASYDSRITFRWAYFPRF